MSLAFKKPDKKQGKLNNFLHFYGRQEVNNFMQADTTDNVTWDSELEHAKDFCDALCIKAYIFVNEDVDSDQFFFADDNWNVINICVIDEFFVCERKWCVGWCYVDYVIFTLT